MTQLDVRRAAQAGRFYPADAAQLAGDIDAALARVKMILAAPKAMAAPHAGYVYSGPIAASAYAQVKAARGAISRVVILCPNHRLPVEGVAASSAAHFATPFGLMPVDRAAVAEILKLPYASVNDAAHADEHAIEVHLPFIQRVLGNVAIVPLIVGRTTPAQVDRLLELLWGGPETLIVVSTDLSHYLDYEAARTSDAAASVAVETLRPDALAESQACGRYALRGLLARAQALDLRATTLDLRNSGDTAGDKARVVGYGAYTFEYADGAALPASWRSQLIDLARQTIVHGAGGEQPPHISFGVVPRPLLAHRSTFVTVKLDGRLRGCVGSVGAKQSLVADVASNAWRAAFGDPRFPPVGPDEAARLGIGVSILSHPRAMAFADEADLLDQIRPDVDGLILTMAGMRGLFLPQVWEQLPDAREFLRRLKQKAGLAADFWSKEMKVSRFTTESFH